MTAVVDPIEREAVRSFSHVLEKRLKIIPAFAYLNSTAAIVFVVSGIWIAATLHHGFPRLIGFGSVLAMNEIDGSFAAPARNCVSRSQMAGSGNSFLSTIAATAPKNHVLWCATDVFKNDELTEAKTCLVDFGHAASNQVVCQVAAEPRQVQSPRLTLTYFS